MKKHGMSRTKTYIAWRDMRVRCNRQSHKYYSYYGGRGISYDPKWDDFMEFYKDIGEIPKGYELDRRDNNLGYYKENCRLVTRSENVSNSRIKRKCGISFKKGKYESTIRIEGLNYHLGRFTSKDQAERTYFEIYFEWHGRHPKNF